MGTKASSQRLWKTNLPGQLGFGTSWLSLLYRARNNQRYVARSGESEDREERRIGRREFVQVRLGCVGYSYTA